MLGQTLAGPMPGPPAPHWDASFRETLASGEASSVVSGCGGGNYCPASSVTREQMSVFLSLTFCTLYGP